MLKHMKTLIPILLFILGGSALAISASNTVYVPVVYKSEATATTTPTATPTPTSTPTPTPTSTPEPGVYIKTIVYKPKGDPLNGEYIELENTDNDDIEITDWFIKAETGQEYIFPTFFLGAGDTVKVWSGSGEDTDTDLYWGSDEPIWNDFNGVAYLRDENRELVDIYEY